MIKVNLSNEQKEWFGERMDESATGRVIVPKYLLTKLKKIADNDSITDLQAKTWLIDNVYNSK